ncbi:MAG TPA: formate/nitrite transporter family protein [Thermoanaerobaculia bacterium]|nr:formate/nitrite transporter family protein [Thermoanaerobaculia bacterium]
MAEDDDEKQEAQQRTAPTGAVVYHAICTEGESELERPSAALFWSALAAGLSMGFSFITTALLHAHTTDGAKWHPLVTALGYPIGFIIVVLGRQQLFTENTLTVVLPFLSRPRLKTFANVARVWGVVLAANVIGAIVVAYVLARSEAVNGEVWEAMRSGARHAYQASFGVTLLRGIFAGWLIALMVWLLPFAESARVWVIGLLTYVVGLAHFSHIIAGSVDAAFLVFAGERSWGDFAGAFFAPTLIGNIIGGVLLVAVINHAQVTAGGGGQDA